MEMFQRQQLQLKFHSLIQMKWVILNQEKIKFMARKWKEGRVKSSSQQELKEEEKYKN